MLRSALKIGLALVAGTLTLANQADAGWRHHGSSGGSSGGWYGSSGGSSGGYGSSGGSSGGWGSSGGSSGGWYGSSGGSYGGHRHGHHRSYWGGYGSSGGSSGGWYGSSGGSSGGWGSSGGSSGGWGSSGGSSGGYSGGVMYGPDVVVPPTMPGVPMGTPVPGGAAPAITPPAAAPAPAPAPMTQVPARSAILNVQVPGEAKVFVNGLATSSTGGSRRYVSHDLEPGFNYTYELKAEIVRDGKTMTDTKVVKLKAGESANLEFDFQASQKENNVATEPVRTKLTLLVPAEARVFLSGTPTASFGPVREFSTTRLVAGNEWKDYVVRVELERDGRLLSQEQTVSLKAGDSRELKIDFDADKVARAGR
jgi:uncharacterized protein (TIGR03000 family)